LARPRHSGFVVQPLSADIQAGRGYWRQEVVRRTLESGVVGGAYRAVVELAVFEKLMDARSEVAGFTDDALRVLIRAQQESRLVNENVVSPESVLLAVIHNPDGAAVRVLRSLCVDPGRVRSQIEEMIIPGPQEVTPGHIALTGGAEEVLKASQREAARLGHGCVGAEHLLLGVIREGRNMAAQILVAMGADLNRVREEVARMAGEGRGASLARWTPPRSAARWLSEQILPAISDITARLSALEGRMGEPAETGDLDLQIERVRREMEAAARVREYERAAELRDQEGILLARRAAHWQEWESIHPKLPGLDEACRQLDDEVHKLRALLRQQGIDPQDGASEPDPARHPFR